MTLALDSSPLRSGGAPRQRPAPSSALTFEGDRLFRAKAFSARENLQLLERQCFFTKRIRHHGVVPGPHPTICVEVSEGFGPNRTPRALAASGQERTVAMHPGEPCSLCCYDGQHLHRALGCFMERLLQPQYCGAARLICGMLKIVIPWSGSHGNERAYL